ncbi:MAG: hypothetical protein KKF24_13075 [Gammaproteobacteria bacterium]|nr:hypothetical protein [Gammaproteobacteria bacterium]MBU1833615.1 hypothetical protein [Gammaproteobacteria bacterium]
MDKTKKPFSLVGWSFKNILTTTAEIQKLLNLDGLTITSHKDQSNWRAQIESNTKQGSLLEDPNESPLSSMLNIIKEATPSNKKVLNIVKKLDNSHTNIIDDNGVAYDLLPVIKLCKMDRLKSETGIFDISHIIPDLAAMRVTARVNSTALSGRVTINLSENEITKIHNARRPSFITKIIASETSKGNICYAFEDENFLKNYIIQIIQILLECGLINKDDFL